MYQEDQLSDFINKYAINSFDELSERDCLPNFNGMVKHDAIVYYNVVFHEDSMMPKIVESIKANRDM